VLFAKNAALQYLGLGVKTYYATAQQMKKPCAGIGAKELQ
jgi:hypothetical protein